MKHGEIINKEYFVLLKNMFKFANYAGLVD